MSDLFNILACGGKIPDEIASLIQSIVTLIQVGIPIILVIMGMLDLGKAVTSQKDDEIKKAQSLLIKRLIYGVLIFLVVAIVKFALGLVGDNAGAAIECLGDMFG